MFKFATVIALALIALVSAEEAGCRPCGIVPRPGRRPCCPSSSDLPPPPPPPPCPCCPAPPSDYWCPCDCGPSSSTICPPPPVPVPPCPVVCCDSSSSLCTSESSFVCPYRRVPVPRPFLKPRCKPVSSSSSTCCCPRKPICPKPKPRHCGCAGPKALDGDDEEEVIVAGDAGEVEEVEGEVLVMTQEDIEFLEAEVDFDIDPEAVEAAEGDEKKHCPKPTCDKKKALQIVFQLDRQFVCAVNQQNLAELYNMVTPNSRYAMITPNADNAACTRIVGPLSQFLPNYIGYTMTSVFQDIAYNEDGSVTIHTLDVLTQGSTSITAEDVWRTYKAKEGCLYKIDYLNGVNWLCK